MKALFPANILIFGGCLSFFPHFFLFHLENDSPFLEKIHHESAETEEWSEGDGRGLKGLTFQ